MYFLSKAPISLVLLSIIDLMFSSSSSSSDVKVNCFGFTSSNGVEVNSFVLNFFLKDNISNFLLKSSLVCLTAISSLFILGVIGSSSFSLFSLPAISAA